MEKYEESRRLKTVQREKGRWHGGETMKENNRIPKDKLTGHFILAHGWLSLYQMMRKWYLDVLVSVLHGSDLYDL